MRLFLLLFTFSIGVLIDWVDAGVCCGVSSAGLFNGVDVILDVDADALGGGGDDDFCVIGINESSVLVVPSVRT